MDRELASGRSRVQPFILQETRGSHLTIKTPASWSAEGVCFPASHGQAVLGLTCPETESGSPGPGADVHTAEPLGGSQPRFSRLAGSPGSLLAPLECPSSPVPTVTARTHRAGQRGAAPPIHPRPVFTVGLPSLEPSTQDEMRVHCQGRDPPQAQRPSVEGSRFLIHPAPSELSTW